MFYILRQQLECWKSRGKKFQLLLVFTSQKQAKQLYSLKRTFSRTAAIELKLGEVNERGSSKRWQGLIPLIITAASVLYHCV